MTKSIDYYFTVASPWTYLAGPRFDGLVTRNGLAVTWKPYDIMRVFGLTGTKPVGQRAPQIQKNRLNELRRWRDFHGMELTIEPAFFPVNPTPANRVVIAALRSGADGGALAKAYMRAVWAEERNTADPETIAAIADENGLDGAALLAQSGDAAAEGEYERNTEDAIAADVFGSPTWIYEGELFWGQDRLAFLTRAVEGTA